MNPCFWIIVVYIGLLLLCWPVGKVYDRWQRWSRSVDAKRRARERAEDELRWAEIHARRNGEERAA